MKMARRHYANTLVLAFLCIGPASAFTTLSGRRPTDGVKDGLLKATMLLQHGNRSAADLEQVAGQLAQLAAAKINGEHMGADLTTAVKAIRELVVGMKKATETEVKQTQENIDELHNRILQCKKPSASASVIEDLEEDSEQQGVKHANCQSALKAKQDNLDQCNSLVETLKKSKESLCQAMEDMSPNPGVCETNDGDTYKAWVERLAGYFDTQMKEYEDKEEKCTDAKRDYEGNKSRCGTLQSGVTGKQETCDAVARELNTKGCLAASTRADVCNQYHCCYTSSTGAYEVAVTNGRQEETAFIAYWTAMAHIECLLDVLVAPDASTDKIDACLSKKIDTTPVELSYPTVPDKEHCEGPSVYPCVPKWMEDHKLKDKSCVPCQGIKDSDSCGTGTAAAATGLLSRSNLRGTTGWVGHNDRWGIPITGVDSRLVFEDDGTMMHNSRSCYGVTKEAWAKFGISDFNTAWKIQYDNSFPEGSKRNEFHWNFDYPTAKWGENFVGGTAEARAHFTFPYGPGSEKAFSHCHMIDSNGKRINQYSLHQLHSNSKGWKIVFPTCNKDCTNQALGMPLTKPDNTPFSWIIEHTAAGILNIKVMVSGKLAMEVETSVPFIFEEEASNIPIAVYLDANRERVSGIRVLES